jgi:4-amino-4-deoxy-L-arabinose transferase-like glycosyltransferase
MDSSRPRAGVAGWVRGLPERHGRLTLALLGLVLLLGLGLRIARALDPIDVPGPDSSAYNALATYLYADGGYGPPGMENENDWSPGAVLVYSGIYFAVGGAKMGAARLAVALLGVILIAVAYVLGRRLARALDAPEGAAGIVAALGVAIYPAFVYDAGRMMSEPFAELALAGFVLAFLWATEEGRFPRALLLPGLLLGLAALFRPEYLVFAAVFAIVTLVWQRRRYGWRDGAIAAGALLLSFCVVVVPWTVRNYVVLDRFVPISTGGGKALFIGTFLPGDGDHYGTKRALYYRYHPNSELPPEEVNLKPMEPLLDRVAARHPELPRDSALAAEGKENLEQLVTEQPGDLLAMMGRKVWRMWRSGSGPSMNSIPAGAVHVVGCLFGLAGLLLLARRRRREALALGALVVGVTAIGAVLLASTRRNLILMPLAFSLAGASMSWLGALLSSWRPWSRFSRSFSPQRASSPPS